MQPEGRHHRFCEQAFLRLAAALKLPPKERNERIEGPYR